MRTPIVTVTICVRNAAVFIDQTLESVLCQTFEDFEVVVIDDGSTDDSADRIRSWSDSRIRLVHQPPSTLRVARPASFAHARGEYLALLDGDDLWAPTKLEEYVATARAHPDAGLFLSDYQLIDPVSRHIGLGSDQYAFGRFDLRPGHAHLSLLTHGNFVGLSTAMVPAWAARSVGGFNHDYQYVNDYDLWLRLARQYRLVFIPRVLASYRQHQSQFTVQHRPTTLAEHRRLLLPILSSRTYPPDVRVAIGDMLLGQHRLACRALLADGAAIPAFRACWGMVGLPGPLQRSLRHRLSRTPIGWVVEACIRSFHRAREARDRTMGAMAGSMRRWRLRGEHVRGRLQRWWRGQGFAAAPPTPPDAQRQATLDVWLDGSCLGAAQAGYFSLLSELIRMMVLWDQPHYRVHVSTDQSGRRALVERLGPEVGRVVFHRVGWRRLHWSHIQRLLADWPSLIVLTAASAALAVAAVRTGAAAVAVLAAIGGLIVVIAACDEWRTRYFETFGEARLRWSARLVRFAWRRWPAPRWRTREANRVEVLFWRGRFRWRNSVKVGVVQDMTTRSHPDLHTPGNVAEFDEYLGYVQRHADVIATVSDRSRDDIIGRIAVAPTRVVPIAMPLHPQYVTPRFDRARVAWHGVQRPYILCLGTLEPRKNLRRVVTAFGELRRDGPARDYELILVGGSGWDAGWQDFLLRQDARPFVRHLGFLPFSDLPSFYHFADAVVYPSVYEGFGLPVLESMCCSSVVAASTGGALPSVLGAAGLLFDPYDTGSLRDVLRRVLLLSPEEAASYRRACRARAELHLARLAAEPPLAHVMAAVQSAGLP